MAKKVKKTARKKVVRRKKSSSEPESWHKILNNKELLWLSLFLKHTAKKYHDLFSRDIEKDLLPEDFGIMPKPLREMTMRHLGPHISEYKNMVTELKNSKQYKIIIDMQKKMEPVGDLIADVDADVLKEVIDTFEEAKIPI